MDAPAVSAPFCFSTRDRPSAEAKSVGVPRFPTRGAPLLSARSQPASGVPLAAKEPSGFIVTVTSAEPKAVPAASAPHRRIVRLPSAATSSNSARNLRSWVTGGGPGFTVTGSDIT